MRYLEITDDHSQKSRIDQEQNLSMARSRTPCIKSIKVVSVVLLVETTKDRFDLIQLLA